MPRDRGAAPVRELERPLFCQLVRQVVRLREGQLEACLDLQRRGGGRVRLGRILLHQGLINREQIMEVLRRQARWVATAMQGDLWPWSLPCSTFLSLCLPAHNEEDNILDTLDAACAILPEFVQRFEVIVVDDGSRDATGMLASAYGALNPNVRVVTHEHRQGYGAAVASGLRAAKGDLVVVADADGGYSLLDLPQFLLRLNGADVVVGYRHHRAEPWHRRIKSWSANQMLRLALGLRVRDVSCGFKMFRREVVDRLRPTAHGPAIHAELIAQCQAGDWRVCETPVTFFSRSRPKPAGGLQAFGRALREFPRLLRHRFLAAPQPEPRTARAEPEPAPVPTETVPLIDLEPGPTHRPPTAPEKITRRLPVLGKGTRRLPILERGTRRLPTLRPRDGLPPSSGAWLRRMIEAQPEDSPAEMPEGYRHPLD